jgi:hypothetical protein
MRLDRRPAEQVMPPEEAASLARTLLADLNRGESRRLRGAFGTLPVGGQVTRDGPRSATFAFFIGERHHGSLTAHVHGGAATDDVRVGDELPAQVLRHLAPLLQPALLGTGACTASEREGITPAHGLRVDARTRMRLRVSGTSAPARSSS